MYSIFRWSISSPRTGITLLSCDFCHRFCAIYRYWFVLRNSATLNLMFVSLHPNWSINVTLTLDRFIAVEMLSEWGTRRVPISNGRKNEMDWILFAYQRIYLILLLSQLFNLIEKMYIVILNCVTGAANIVIIVRLLM